MSTENLLREFAYFNLSDQDMDTIGPDPNERRDRIICEQFINNRIAGCIENKIDPKKISLLFNMSRKKNTQCITEVQALERMRHYLIWLYYNHSSVTKNLQDDKVYVKIEDIQQYIDEIDELLRKFNIVYIQPSDQGAHQNPSTQGFQGQTQTQTSGFDQTGVQDFDANSEYRGPEPGSFPNMYYHNMP